MCAGKKQQKQETVTVVTASTMQYLTQHPNTHEEGNNVLKVCRWSIAAGKRPVPFRTRKLSLHTLMVLQPGGCGRVSHRRHQTTKTQQNTTKKRTVYHRPLLFAFTLIVLGQPTNRTTMASTSTIMGSRKPTLNLSFYPRCLVKVDSGVPCGFRATIRT